MKNSMQSSMMKNFIITSSIMKNFVKSIILVSRIKIKMSSETLESELEACQKMLNRQDFYLFFHSMQ